jgi:hypothetical protein
LRWLGTWESRDLIDRWSGKVRTQPEEKCQKESGTPFVLTFGVRGKPKVEGIRDKTRNKEGKKLAVLRMH